MILIRLFNKELSKKSRITIVMISCLIYLLLSISLRLFTIESKAYVIFQTEINSFVIRGVITQVQILISVFIVLKLNKA